MADLKKLLQDMGAGIRRPIVLLAAASFLVTGCAGQREASNDAAMIGAIDSAVGSLNRRAPRQPNRQPAAELRGAFKLPGSGVQAVALGFGDLPGWEKDNHAAAYASFRESCIRIMRLKNASPIGGAVTTLNDWKAVCAEGLRIQPSQAKSYFETVLSPVRFAPQKPAHLTAYYVPEIKARRRPDNVYRHPIYRKPPDLVVRGGKWGRDVGGRIVPHYSRGEVYRGALNGKGLEIAYLADPVDLMYLQIQGSGRLRMGDGSSVNVGYAGKSGHKFRSAASLMIKKGLSRSGSQSDLSAYVRQNPAAGFELLAHNQSYIYFEEKRNLNPRLGAVGALGVQLSDQRSIAVDKSYTPLGAPVWIEGPTPIGYFQRLMIAQDVGSAIRGPQRADLYWGSGDRAGSEAMRTNTNKGRLTVLLPRAVVARHLHGRP